MDLLDNLERPPTSSRRAVQEIPKELRRLLTLHVPSIANWPTSQMLAGATDIRGRERRDPVPVEGGDPP